ncbi:hypothetical protein BGZ83_007666 [Gryganskiella cystojenkinii]|nr:hypothetical protein BGZ83_007666 [Gryganskiella cystojenkinii]
MLPYIYETETKPLGRASILVTLWDEHIETAQSLGVKTGDIVFLKNVNSKDTNGNIELVMRGWNGRGRRELDPISILSKDDPLAITVLNRKVRYNMDLQRLHEERAATLGSIHDDKQQPQSPSQSSTATALGLPNRSQSVVTNAPHTCAQVLNRSGGVDKTVLPSSTRPEDAVGKCTTSSQPHPESDENTRPLTPSTQPSKPTARPQFRPESDGDSRLLTSSTRRKASTSPEPKIKPEIESPRPKRTKDFLADREPTPSQSLNRLTCVSQTSVKNEVRRLMAEDIVGLHFASLAVRVIGYSPEDMRDFSRPKCSNCKHDYGTGPDRNHKAGPMCPKCGLRDMITFEFEFKLHLIDAFEQTYVASLDHDSALMLTNAITPANYYKNKNALIRLKECLATIGVTDKISRSAPYIHCCLRTCKLCNCKCMGRGHRKGDLSIVGGGEITHFETKSLSSPSGYASQEESDQESTTGSSSYMTQSMAQKRKATDISGRQDTKRAANDAQEESNFLQSAFQCSLMYTKIL